MLWSECSVVNSASGTVFTTFHFLQNLQMGPRSWVLHYTRLKRLAMVQHSSLFSSFICYEASVVLWLVNSPAGTVFTTFHLLQNLQMGPSSWVLHYTRLERLAMVQHSSLLDPFICYEASVVLWIGLLGLCSQHFTFFRTYKWVQGAECYITLDWKGLQWSNTRAYWTLSYAMKRV